MWILSVCHAVSVSGSDRAAAERWGQATDPSLLTFHKLITVYDSSGPYDRFNFSRYQSFKKLIVVRYLIPIAYSIMGELFSTH